MPTTTGSPRATWISALALVYGKLQQSLLTMSPSQPRQNHPGAVCSRAVHSGQGSDYANIEAVGRSLGKIR